MTRVCCGRKQRAGEPRRRRSSTPASSCPRSRAPPPRPAAHRQASSITRARKNLRNRNKTGDTRARRRAAGALSGRSPSLYPPPRTQNTPSTSLACSAEAGTSSTEPAGGCAVSQGPPGGVRAMAARAPDRVAEDLAARGRVERHLERERIHEERRRAPLPRRLCTLEERTNLAHCRCALHDESCPSGPQTHGKSSSGTSTAREECPARGLVTKTSLCDACQKVSRGRVRIMNSTFSRA